MIILAFQFPDPTPHSISDHANCFGLSSAGIAGIFTRFIAVNIPGLWDRGAAPSSANVRLRSAMRSLEHALTHLGHTLGSAIDLPPAMTGLRLTGRRNRVVGVRSRRCSGVIVRVAGGYYVAQMSSASP